MFPVFNTEFFLFLQSPDTSIDLDPVERGASCKDDKNMSNQKKRLKKVYKRNSLNLFIIFEFLNQNDSKIIITSLTVTPEISTNKFF